MIYFTLASIECTTSKPILSSPIFQTVESEKVLQLGAICFDEVSPWEEITLETIIMYVNSNVFRIFWYNVQLHYFKLLSLLVFIEFNTYNINKSSITFITEELNDVICLDVNFFNKEISQEVVTAKNGNYMHSL